MKDQCRILRRNMNEHQRVIVQEVLTSTPTPSLEEVAAVAATSVIETTYADDWMVPAMSTDTKANTEISTNLG